MKKTFEDYSIKLTTNSEHLLTFVGLKFAFEAECHLQDGNQHCEITSPVEVFDEEENTWHPVPEPIARAIEATLHEDLFYTIPNEAWKNILKIEKNAKKIEETR